MRGRIIRTLCAAAAASAASALGCAAAGASPAVQALSGGPPEYTCAPLSDTASPPCEAGYEADGRDFRYARAIITVPNHIGLVASDPMLYVALDDTSATAYDFARVGVEPVCTTVSGGFCTAPSGHASGWEAFAQVREPNGVLPLNVAVPLATSVMGDGVFVSVYFDQVGNSIHVVATPPAGVAINQTQAVTGPLYTRAQALADWAPATTKPAPVPPGVVKIRDSQFLQGGFTTLSGTRGRFSGAWTLNSVEATTNGSLPPAGTLIAQPSYLWSDTSGVVGDAFGVWRYPF